MIPRLRPDLGWPELLAAFALPRPDDLARFETAFAREMGQREAIAFPYGRTGLLLLLRALGLQGREIICPAYTCVVVPHAIVLSGNVPVFVDSRAGDFNMDLDLAEEAITGKTGAIIATSLFGYPVDLDRLEALRRRHPDLLIIQDCAHSFAAEWQGRPVQQGGTAAIFGLNISKLLTSVFGGMVTTDDPALAARLRELRDREVRAPGAAKSLRRLLYLLAVYPAFLPPVYGLINRLERSGWLNRFVRYYDEGKIEMPGDYLEGMTGVEARVGLAQLGKYRRLVERRQQAAAVYDRLLAKLPGLQLPPLVPGATYSHYVVVAGERSPWLAALLARGIQLGWLIEYCIPEMAAYRDCRYLSRAHLAEAWARRTINLPLWGGAALAERVAGALLAAAGREPAGQS